MPTADRLSKRGKAGEKASLGKPKGGSTEWYVTEEVNPIDKTSLSEEGARFANTKKSYRSAGLRGRRTLIFIRIENYLHSRQKKKAMEAYHR
jgi:hypothetical protein